ncbi:RagB/SusD family nutrient uptake outer membrane protein [Ginsengibacter hankyongi]|uniref:RagB/SusD family nutrient uptake outer membrane protein n=1 Tax=Ginsengibacter hankyongi TaxID=2607284 RepID=A0A5J5IFV0_9BACT|nr:RagB/SusD family nutrient uptake outer membrane protein [Ginsengibacter hankyongi]KAA9038659.1 RagB/SusD family nutrient uptake outer membrane protein [Ginsengibacter hankyongi]
MKNKSSFLYKAIKIDFKNVLLLILSVQLFSCKKNVLETKPLNALSADVVWTDASLMDAYISNTYRILPHGFQFNSRRLFCISDESKARGATAYSVINSGNITPSGLGPLDYWIGTSADPGYYKCITQCNIFLSNAKDAQIDTATKNRMIGEVKTLRAFSYFRLTSFFGGVPLITQPFTLNDSFDLPRNTYEECMDFVTKELDEAINLLPLAYTAKDQGRITKGAAMAIKSRVLLYAASPLNNPQNDLSKWQKAADAAKAVIDLNKYQLYPDYKKMFLSSNAFNSEMIWARPFNHIADPEGVGIELRFYSNGFNGYGQIEPLQNLVDQYETVNGKLPADDPAYNPQDPYVNRDPRFYATILYDGAPFKGRQIETFLPGGKDSKDGALSPWNTSETGYYARKYIDESITNPSYTNASDPQWPFVRYAEMLLNYAEAEFHLGNEDICREYINLVRNRPGVNMPPVTESGDALLKRLENEDFIEFAFEGHRYFDVRRWEIAPIVLNVPAKGMLITKDANGNKNYKIFTVEQRHFNSKNYLVPIPQSEIDKDTKLIQNPGY